MPYCRDCGAEFLGRNTYCDSCEQDIIERSRDSIDSATETEQRRMKNDKNYAHAWLQDSIGWIVDLMKIITKIWSGGCYITTAVVHQQGLADDCLQMQKFRAFRKSYIIDACNMERIADLDEYYFQSQILVCWVQSRADRDLIWRYVEKYITHFSYLLDTQGFEEAYSFFKIHTIALRRNIFYEMHKK